MNINGLELIALDSTVTPIPCISNEEVLQLLNQDFPEKAFVVACLDYKVEIGLWEKQNVIFSDPNESLNPRFIQKLRVFDVNKELLIWRSCGSLKGRLREDQFDGNQQEVIVANQVLFGTQKTDLEDNQFSVITEERGTRLSLPFKNYKVDEKRNRACIKTFNYIGYLEDTFQATYTDCRFVSFTNGKNDLI